MSEPAAETVRLNRFLAQVGVASRRRCDEIIAAGRVRVDGRVARSPGERVDPDRSRVTVDGAAVTRPRTPVVLLLHKPTGVVSTAYDPQGRATVLDLCRPWSRRRRLFPVGRLDVNTTGALLVTNDGLLCYRLTHPRFGVPRTYVVRVRGNVDEGRLRRLDRMAQPPREARIASPRARPGVTLTHRRGREATLRITLVEGKNRQIHRMCAQVGLHVTALKRVQYGPVSVRKLPLGAARPLEPDELARLRRMVGLPVEGK